MVASCSGEIPWLSRKRQIMSPGMSMAAKASELTLMLSLATSIAAALVSAFTPPLVAAYRPFAGTAVMSLVTEDMFTIDPPPRLRITAISYLRQDNRPFRFTAMSWSKIASVASAIMPVVSVPALFTAQSRPPYLSTAVATSCFTAASSATSASTNVISPPAVRAAAAAACPPSTSTSHPTTFAPSAANASARTRPHPFATPVTNTTLPSSTPMVASFAGESECAGSRSDRTASLPAHEPCAHPVASAGRYVLGVAMRVGPWELLDRRFRLKKSAGQGLTTVTADGRATLLYRGESSIPKNLRAQGWVHIGDPGSWGGYVVDAYQGRRGARSKLYEVITPAGDRYAYDHALDATLDPP